jgi:hypothetical protein
MAKKLIFCFDGTSHDPEDAGNFFEDSSISNVLKLHAFFGGKLNPANAKNDVVENQHSFYYSGVGTRGSWLKQKLNLIFAPPYGDMDDILDEAEADLNRYVANDSEIYIFGFSRGAAIARIFASQVAKKRKIKFLGVFDTVAATRGSLDLNPDTFPSSEIVFENATIADEIERAVHLLSIDEKRIAFQPTLFNHNPKKVKEVWFAGVHTDVGGGYWFDGLSDITLKFMIDEIKDELTVLPIGSIDPNWLKVKGAQDTICIDDLNINPLIGGKLHEQQRSGILAKKTLAPRLVRVNEDDMPTIDKNKHPIIHHSVVERFKQVSAYRPYALRGVTYRVLNADGSLSGLKHGITELAKC